MSQYFLDFTDAPAKRPLNIAVYAADKGEAPRIHQHKRRSATGNLALAKFTRDCQYRICSSILLYHHASF